MVQKFREKILKRSEAVARSCSTDYLFWEFKKIPPKKSQLPRPVVQQDIDPITLFDFCTFLKISKKLLLLAAEKA